VERGGWNGPRKHGEGGNTPAVRGLTRGRVGRDGGAGRWRVTTAFCARLSACEYVYDASVGRSAGESEHVRGHGESKGIFYR